jgi:uncharacterized protein YacL
MHAGIGIRTVGAVGFALLGWQVGSLLGDGSHQPRNAMLGIAIGAIAGFAIAPYVVGKPYVRARGRIHRLPAAELVSGIVGLILGLVVAALLAYPLSFLPWSLGHLLPAIAAIVCGYVGISLLLLRHRDLSHFVQARTHLPSAVEVAPGMEYLVDTSTIIDGRIADISQAGFLYGTLVVPRFVLTELQHIADSGDPLRRNRGKRGLDMLKRLQSESSTPLRISDDDPRDVPDVDGKLVKLARNAECPVITNDFNLNRIAELQGVRVLNINLLANAVKPVILPGEEMNIRIIQEGREFNQGVGYLEDGTMIVVENGKKLLNRQADVVVIRVLQTAAGRMIFAQLRSGISQ